MNVFYKTSNFEEWIPIAERLYDEHDWNPVYWVSHPDLEEGVSSAFPEAIHHSKYDANRARFPEPIQSVDKSPLDKPILERYRDHRYIILRLMDRMDSGNNFNYDERVRLYHDSLRCWDTIIDHFEIELAVFARTPHGVAENIVYAICEEREIDTVMLSPTSLPGVSFARKNLLKPNSEIAKRCESLGELANISISKSSHRYIQKTAGGYNAPWYMDKDQKSPYFNHIQNLSNYPKYITKLFDKKETDDKVKDKTIEQSEIPIWKDVISDFRATWYKWQLKREYRSLASSPEYSNTYIYIPLHFQPERTTMPEGSVFYRQFLIADLLDSVIPDGWHLYVKEHPIQFSSRRIGERGRATYDYHDLLDIDSVTLINSNTESFDLIDNSEAVATVTGTAGWESVIRGTPSIIFGNPWYRGCPGVYHVETKLEIEYALEEIQDGIDINLENIKKFTHIVEDVGYRGYQSNNWEDSKHIPSETNIENIVNILERYAKAPN